MKKSAQNQKIVKISLPSYIAGICFLTRRVNGVSSISLAMRLARPHREWVRSHAKTRRRKGKKRIWRSISWPLQAFSPLLKKNLYRGESSTGMIPKIPGKNRPISNSCSSHEGPPPLYLSPLRDELLSRSRSGGP